MLEKEIQYIKGVGEARAKTLNKLRYIHPGRPNYILS